MAPMRAKLPAKPAENSEGAPEATLPSPEAVQAQVNEPAAVERQQVEELADDLGNASLSDGERERANGNRSPLPSDEVARLRAALAEEQARTASLTEKARLMKHKLHEKQRDVNKLRNKLKRQADASGSSSSLPSSALPSPTPSQSGGSDSESGELRDKPRRASRPKRARRQRGAGSGGEAGASEGAAGAGESAGAMDADAAANSNEAGTPAGEVRAAGAGNDAGAEAANGAEDGDGQAASRGTSWLQQLRPEAARLDREHIPILMHLDLALSDFLLYAVDHINGSLQRARSPPLTKAEEMTLQLYAVHCWDHRGGADMAGYNPGPGPTNPARLPGARRTYAQMVHHNSAPVDESAAIPTMAPAAEPHADAAAAPLPNAAAAAAPPAAAPATAPPARAAQQPNQNKEPRTCRNCGLAVMDFRAHNSSGECDAILKTRSTPYEPAKHNRFNKKSGGGRGNGGRNGRGNGGRGNGGRGGNQPNGVRADIGN